MISLVQRVSRASVTVDEESYRAGIGRGLCVLLGVEDGDGPAQASWMARKLAFLRIFPDEAGKMNRSVRDVGGEALVVSQFTLAGDCSRGHRPSFVRAAPPAVGEALYEQVCRELEAEQGIPVRTGLFGAMMQVELINDGPVTVIVRSETGRSADQ
jgi:D-tyrosyl-tRNA(Tyr) deacylase